MKPTRPRSTKMLETRLHGLREHTALGPGVRFYFRHREQLLYLLVGGWNTLFGYGIWALMQYVLGDFIPYLVVVLLAWPIAVLNAFIGYRYIVFRSRGPVRTEFLRFSLVYVVTLAANLALLPIALKLLPFNIYLIQALFLSVVIVSSYLSHKRISFGGGHRGQPGDPPPPDTSAVYGR